MNKYYEVTATLDGETEVLFGSFVKQDCTYEIESEKVSWKEEGYKAIKVCSRDVDEAPCPTVYTELVTAKELWMKQAPHFNFELNEEELLEEALNAGYVTLIDEENGLYSINSEY